MNDTVIIGGGIAGYTLAIELADHDIPTTLIEKAELGGTCLNRGCIPTKALLHAPKNSDLNENLGRSRNIVTHLREMLMSLIQSKRIRYVNDEAKILTRKSILLRKDNEKIGFDKLILAVGSEMLIPSMLKDATNVLTTDEVFGIEILPERLIVLGGGYIGVEFATILSNLGSKVTIIEQKESILPMLEKDLAGHLADNFKKRGIDIITGQAITQITESTVTLSNGQTVAYDKILIATGRKPANIESDIPFEQENGAIKTDGYFETSEKGIFVIGDASGGPMLAHKAEYDARLLAKNLLGIKEQRDYSRIPFCIFSDPQIATIGRNEGAYKIKLPFKAIGKSYCDDCTEGFLKLILDEKKAIIGAQVVNKHATELISALIVIVNGRMTCEEVSKIVFAHPTLAEIIKEAAIKGLSC